MTRLRPLRLFAMTLLASAMTFIASADQTTWIPFRNDSLGFSIKVPGDWTAHANGKAAAFTGPGDLSTRGAIGVLKSSVQGLTIEQAADKEFKAQGKPSDWHRSPAKFAGARALKIIGSTKKDPSRKMVEYYIEAPNGYYLVQCLAPAADWATFSPLFSVMIQSFQFI